MREVLFSVPVGLCAVWGAHAQGTHEPADVLEGADRQALRFLESLPRKWSGTSNRDCKTYEDKNIEKLSLSFAVSAAAFLKAFVEMHGPVTITSAHRTAREQACVCEGEKGPCAGRPRIVKTKKGRRVVKRGTSRHQSGIALDVRAGTGTDEDFACMHEFAQFNPQFGVHFPMGKRDKPHMEPRATTEKKVQVAVLGAVRHQVSPCTTIRIAERRIDTALERSARPEGMIENLCRPQIATAPTSSAKCGRTTALGDSSASRVVESACHTAWEVATRFSKSVKSSAIAASVDLHFGRSSRAQFISAHSSNAMLERE